MESSMSEILRFIVNVEEGVLLELSQEGATASLPVKYHEEFGCDPDYETVAVAGLTFDLEGDERGVCVSRTPSVAAANEAIRLITLKYGIVKRLNRPPYGFSDEHHVVSLDWTLNLDRHRYDSSVVKSWPELSNRPIADKIVIEYTDQLTFVPQASRTGEPSPPASTIAEALTFSSFENAQAWIERHASAERNDLVLRFRSVALALMDQSDAEVNEGMRG